MANMAFESRIANFVHAKRQHVRGKESMARDEWQLSNPELGTHNDGAPASALQKPLG
jgi:hypothetical protein